MITLSYLQLYIIISVSAGFGMFVAALFAGSDGPDECYYCPFPCERHES